MRQNWFLKKTDLFLLTIFAAETQTMRGTSSWVHYQR